MRTPCSHELVHDWRSIEGEPGTPKFLRSYEAASRSAIRADTDTLAGIIARYKRASEFTDLAPRTREDYDAHLAWSVGNNHGYSRFAVRIARVLRWFYRLGVSIRRDLCPERPAN